MTKHEQNEDDNKHITYRTLLHEWLVADQRHVFVMARRGSDRYYFIASYPDSQLRPNWPPSETFPEFVDGVKRVAELGGFAFDLQARPNPWKEAGLSYAEITIACNNIGVDLRCGGCASAFYTGYPEEHDEHCTIPWKVVANSTRDIEPARVPEWWSLNGQRWHATRCPDGQRHNALLDEMMRLVCTNCGDMLELGRKESD